MIKLHGFAISNYYNMVKLTLEEKGIAYEEVSQMPSQEPAYKARSPMGKVPCIESEQGVLSETAAILDYLEDIRPTPRLYPADPFARAKTRELMRITELYVELAARRHYRHVFFGDTRSEAAVAEVRPVVENGLAALRQLGRFAPYVCGADFTFADVYAYYSFGYARMALQTIYGWDIVSEVPGLQATLDAIAARPAVKKVDADQQAAFAAFKAAQG